MIRERLTIAFLIVAGAAAICFRALEAKHDPLDYDEYELLCRNDGTFAASIQAGDFAVPLPAYYWLAGRVCGKNIPCYRTGTLTCSLLLVMVMSIWTWLQWPDAPARAWAVLLLLTPNSYSAALAGYAMISYAFTVLLFAALLAGLAWPRPIGPSRVQWLLLAVAGAAAGGLASTVALAGLASYAAAVALARRLARGTWRHSIRWIEVFVLVILTVSILAVLVLAPFRNFGAHRIDMAPLFYPDSGSESLLQYLLSRAYAVVATLLSSNQHSAAAAWTWRLFAGGLALLGGLRAALRPVKSPDDRFVLLTLALGLSGAALGGMLGLFPFGPRYVPFLLPPLILLGAIGASALWRVATEAISRRILDGLLIAGGCLTVLFWANGLSARKIELDKQSSAQAVALSVVSAHTDAPILHDSYLEPLLKIRFSNRLPVALSMGWGSYWHKGEAVDWKMLAGERSLMVVTRVQNWETEFPKWSRALTERSFKKVGEYPSPNLTVRLYEQSDDSGSETDKPTAGSPVETPRGRKELK
jgi:hypothetical protein